MECHAHPVRSDRSARKESRVYKDSLSRLNYSMMNGTASSVLHRLLPTGHVPHICIVGAGMAGLRCAHVLVEKGMKVMILEGRDRIGGRIHQSSQRGHVVDLGPNWIHGTDHNPILDLAIETNAVTFSPPENSMASVYNEAGHLLEAKTATRCSELVWNIIGEAFKHSNKNSDSIPPELSLMDFFMTQVKAREIDAESSKLVFQMAKMWGDFVGEPIEMQSLKYFWLEECIEGENLFLASTYAAILSRVAKNVVTKADLKLSTKVTSITCNTQDARRPSITITTNTNTTHTFDEVIITAPLGWLKRNTSSFTPPLLPRITAAIKNISYGRLEKVYVTFPSPFWKPPDSPSNISTKPNLPPFFTQFLSPTYALQNPKSWIIECVSLASLPASHAHATLLFYIHGPCAQHVTSLIHNLEPTDTEYYTRLDDFFKPYYTRLPNYNNHQPEAIIATNWQNDELAGFGSYTTFQTSDPERDGKVLLDKDIETLREGCPELGIWFAGEHTAPFVALGTVTGAYQSGEAVGKRIAAVNGMSGKAEGSD